MNFAPYQDESPDIERVRSPPPIKGRPSLDNGRGISSPAQRPQTHTRAISDIQSLPPPNYFGDDTQVSPPAERGRGGMDVFETSLPLRLDYEAMLAYLLLPPVGGLFLLLVEHKSDYVRFHAWQSSMLFAAIFVVHLIFSWSKIVSWVLFGLDLVLIAFLARHAYKDVDTLEHYEVPIFGRFANRFVEDE